MPPTTAVITPTFIVFQMEVIVSGLSKMELK